MLDCADGQISEIRQTSKVRLVHPLGVYYALSLDTQGRGNVLNGLAKSLTLSDPETNSQTTSFLSLPNGCLCCSFKDMGIAAIEEMVASQKGVDWVMVELTGVADPGKLAVYIMFRDRLIGKAR